MLRYLRVSALVFGSGNSQIATLVERQTRYAMLVKLDGKDSQTVVKALIKNARKLPQELYKSLTWDRGTEMHAHKQFTMATDIQVYFCDPQSPWQRGSREHERIAPAVHAQGHGPLEPVAASAQRHCQTIEREATQDAWLPHAR